MITWANWKARIRSNAFPEDKSRETRTRDYNYILDGLIELQQKVTCLRQRHRDVTPFARTLYHCGATVIPAPAKSIIHGLSTKTADDVCAVVNYEAVSYDDMECYLRDLADCGCGVPELYGYYYDDDVGYYLPYPAYDDDLFHAEAVTDKTCRAGGGFYTLHRGMIWIYPSLQSDESVILEWEGMKRKFEEADEIDEDLYDREIESALEHYLRMKSAENDDDNVTSWQIKYEYWTRDLIPRLIYLCYEQGQLPVKKRCFTNCGVNKNFAFPPAPTTRVIEHTVTQTLMTVGTGGLIRSYALLRAVTGYADLDSRTVVGTNDVADPPIVGGGGIFWMDISSFDADDGGMVIKPNDKTALQAGRWKRL